jgi:hypothetical protein
MSLNGYIACLQYVRDMKMHPGLYILLNNNCTTKAALVTVVAGVNNPSLQVATPYSMSDALNALPQPIPTPCQH